MPSIMQPLREEHQELLPQIERLRAVADVIGDASVETLQQAVDEVYAFLTLQLIPHAHAEECMEALFDQERCECRNLGEHEEAQVEAERRRWTAGAGA